MELESTEFKLRSPQKEEARDEVAERKPMDGDEVEIICPDESVVRSPEEGYFWKITVLEAVRFPKKGEEEALNVYVEPLEVMARGPLAVAEFKQLAHVRVPVSWAKAKGEDIMADPKAVPFPKRSPPRVVEAVPPLATVKAVSKVRELACTVEEAVIVPKKGEEEALNVWVVPAETIANGPLVENVWVPPVSPLREVMADVTVQVPFIW